ncbi:TonB-dependent receptor [Compostibacter hankyongensis]|uniref:TonB-dependent receptor n=1 Tax=Compostibacter hankyongensis TaxID=1007089 RepID=A0ABP8FH10_9BACT
MPAGAALGEYGYAGITGLPDKKVNGIVTDSSGAPLPGVTVYVKDNKSVGTTTDLNGRYIIEVPEQATLVFSMVGFDIQEIPAAGRSEINIKLLPASNQLGETVVVAFGTQKKQEVVGSVTTINPGELKVPSSNLTTALAGRLAGMIAYQRSGEPGLDNANFFIRGVTTFGYKKDPLILVDGIELTATDLARMQVDDIASFSILKDATATALYGARGANGIILITTKEGAEGKAKISIRLENSMSAPTRNVELADPITYMKLNNEAVLTRNPLGSRPYSPSKIDNTIAGTDPYAFPATDWRDVLFKDYTMNQRANMNVSGGGKVARYYLAATFNQDNGILKVDHRNNFNNNINLKTYELRSNVNINITKTTEVGVKLYGTFDDYTGPVNGGTQYYREAVRSDPVSFPPYFPVDEAHSYVHHILFGNTSDILLNPYAEMVSGYKEYNQSLMLAQFNLKQDLSFITEGLNLQGLFNTTRYAYFDVNRSYKPYWYQVGFYDKVNKAYTLSSINEDEGTEYLGYDEGPKKVNTTTYIQLTANYNRTFHDKHNLSGLLVFLMQNKLSGNAGTLQTSLAHRNIGVSGRYTYAYDNRYFAEFDFGYNGSERFYKTHRFGFFPSAGIGWQVSGEKFWKPLSHTITNLKLRATYGLIGNDAIGSDDDRFFYLSEVNLDDPAKAAIFGLDNTYARNGVTVNRYSNPYITWEKAYKTNVGMDLGLFNTVNIIADIWKEHRTHILMTRSYIPTLVGLSGGSVPQANVGEAEGKGIDLSIDYSQFFGQDIWVQARANFTYAASKFLVYEEPTYENAPWKSHVGHSLSQQWGYIAERLFVDDNEVSGSPTQNFGVQVMGGDIKYRDINGDGQITTLDQVPIGYPTDPEIVYGFGVSAGYKNFDLSFFFQGLARESFWIDPKATAPFVNYLYDNEKQNNPSLTGQPKNQLLKAYADDHWSEDNQNLYALWPRLSTSENPNNSQKSTWFMNNGAFLRLKNVELGYTLPQRLTKRMFLEKVRFYLSGTNLLSFSQFKIWDVEMAGNGLDYPVQRVFNAGVQISF